MISTQLNGVLVAINEKVIVNNISQTEATIVKIFEENDEVVLRLDNGVSEMNIPAKYCKVKV